MKELDNSLTDHEERLEEVNDLTLKIYELIDEILLVLDKF